MILTNRKIEHSKYEQTIYLLHIGVSNENARIPPFVGFSLQYSTWVVINPVRTCWITLQRGFPTSSSMWSLMFCRSLWPLILNTGNPSGVWSLMFCRSLWPLMLNTGNPSGVWSLMFCRSLWPLMLNTGNPLWNVIHHVLSEFMTTHVEYWESLWRVISPSCSVEVYDHSCWILGPPSGVWPVMFCQIEYRDSALECYPHVLSEFMTTHFEHWNSLWSVIPHVLSESMIPYVEYCNEKHKKVGCVYLYVSLNHIASYLSSGVYNDLLHTIWHDYYVENYLVFVFLIWIPMRSRSLRPLFDEENTFVIEFLWRIFYLNCWSLILHSESNSDDVATRVL